RLPEWLSRHRKCGECVAFCGVVDRSYAALVLANILLTLGVPGIVRCLHAYPNAGAIAEQFSEANSHSRRNRVALAQNIIEMLAGNTEEPRNLSLCPTSGRNDILPQQRARDESDNDLVCAWRHEAY